MKRTLSILFFVLFGFVGSAIADTHLWITTEGVGIEYSSEGVIPGPPPPPPPHRHHHCHNGKKYRKMKKKNEKKMRKMYKGHDKVMNKTHKHH